MPVQDGLAFLVQFCARVLPRSGGPALLPPREFLEASVLVLTLPKEFLDFRYVCRAFLGIRELRLLEDGGDPMRALRTRIVGSRRADGFMEGWVMLDSARACDLFLKRNHKFVFGSLLINGGHQDTRGGKRAGANSAIVQQRSPADRRVISRMFEGEVAVRVALVMDLVVVRGPLVLLAFWWPLVPCHGVLALPADTWDLSCPMFVSCLETTRLQANMNAVAGSVKQLEGKTLGVEQHKELSEITKSWFPTEVEEWEGRREAGNHKGWVHTLQDSPKPVREVERRRRWGISLWVIGKTRVSHLRKTQES